MTLNTKWLLACCLISIIGIIVFISSIAGIATVEHSNLGKLLSLAIYAVLILVAGAGYYTCLSAADLAIRMLQNQVNEEEQ